MCKKCCECGTDLVIQDKSKEFCDTACRISFHNRRKKRGAEMYDLFMHLRYNRKEAQGKEVWSLICNMAMTWNEEDQEAGRVSYHDLNKACQLTAKYRAKKYAIRV